MDSRTLYTDPVYPPEDESPTEDDLYTFDYETFYSYGSNRPVLGVDPEEDLKGQLLAWMEGNNWFPSVWFVDDHGGVTLLRWVDA